MRIAFSARWDQEKQPDFYMDVIEEFFDRYGLVDRHGVPRNVEFCVFSGSALKSNNDSYMQRTRDFQSRGLLRVYEDLDKNAYYSLLNDTRILFNCALQDWVSNTVSEADTLGCNVLYPAYRSFPETFANDPERMYIPWSMTDAMNTLDPLLVSPHTSMGRISDWNNGTVDRIVDIIQGSGEKWNRSGNRYRDHVAGAKYK
jgi:hypothetical protein